MSSVKRHNLDGAVYYEHEPFGDQIPFGDPSWYQGHRTPYYTESHAAYRKKVRDFMEKEIAPFVHEWDEAGTYPRELHQKAYQAGVYGCQFPKEYGGNGPEDADVFHSLILSDEQCRCASGGVVAAVWTSIGIGLPPLLAVGSEQLKRRVAPPCIRGEKIICLAITEPWAGSDVANIRTTARREGNFYIVNGQKKFITSGGHADFFTTAVRTGGPGMGGISLLLLEKGMPGIKIRRLKTQGWWMSYTAHITFEDVKVPVENLIGHENQGFLPIMLNFNQERFGGVIMCLRFSRVCIEESIKYARMRKTFGKPLIANQTIRSKIANMARRVEALSAWCDALAHQYKTGVEANVLGQQTALMKVEASQTLEFCAREASQVFGGNSYLRGGIGEKVERIYREVRVVAIGGGSEEILLDLAARMARL